MGWGAGADGQPFCCSAVAKAIHLGVFSLLAAVLIRTPYAIPAIAALWTGIERTHGTFGFAWLALGNCGHRYAAAFAPGAVGGRIRNLVRLRLDGRDRRSVDRAAESPAVILDRGHPRAIAASRSPRARHRNRNRRRRSAQHVRRYGMDGRIRRPRTRPSGLDLARRRRTVWRAAHLMAGSSRPPLLLSGLHFPRGSRAPGTRHARFLPVWNGGSDTAWRPAEFRRDAAPRWRSRGSLRQDQPGPLRRVRSRRSSAS